METNEHLYHRQVIGGMWDTMGEFQLKYLIKKGLRPHHYLLDIGCGSLRGGVHFVKYLDKGRYYGVDRQEAFLKSGEKELELLELKDKGHKLFQIQDFDFTSLNRKFDYALAQSVFTHLNLNDIFRCIYHVKKTLKPGGKFFATFFECESGERCLEPVTYELDMTFKTKQNNDPYHYSRGLFEWIAKDAGLKFRYIGDWNHPRFQKMMLFENVKK